MLVNFHGNSVCIFFVEEWGWEFPTKLPLQKSEMIVRVDIDHV